MLCLQEACRLLDKYGALLSGSGHESQEAKRVKRWEQNDYYSSDEDEYLDRTKTIQVKNLGCQNFTIFYAGIFICYMN